MEKLIFISPLFLMTSWTAYGQEVIGYGTIAKRGDQLDQQVPWSDFSLKPSDLSLKRGELQSPGFLSEEYVSIDRIDPSMPIAVPPNNPIKFPIKIIPEDFPSNMPVARLLDPMYPALAIHGKKLIENYFKFKAPDYPYISSPSRRLVPHSFE